MAAKLEPSDIDYLVEQYTAGAVMHHLLKARGISTSSFHIILRKRGIEPRSVKDRRWQPADPAAVIASYKDGTSIKAIAEAAGVSRNAVKGFLLRNGVEVRGRSAAEKVKWARIKQDRALVERQCAKAWEAARGRKLARHDFAMGSMFEAGHTTQEIANALGVSKPYVKKRLRELGFDLSGRQLVSRARGVQAFQADGAIVGGLVSPVELDILAALRARGAHPRHQYALGTRNIDLAFEELRIAVEIERRWLGEAKSLRRERLEDLFHRGWRLLVVYLPRHGRRTPDLAAIADKIIAFRDLVRAHPALPGQYGVIGGDGQPSTLRRDYFHGASRVEGF